jgi:hypothetical protein
MIADERGLIAPGEAVDDAGRACLAREQRAGERVGLDIDHDDVLAVRDCLERMANAGRRHAGRLHHHFQIGKCDHRLGIGAHVRAAALIRVGDGFGQGDLLRPARSAQLIFRARNVEIGDRDHMQPARESRLCKKHGAELAGPNHAHGHRATGGFALEQHRAETHTAPH